MNHYCELYHNNSNDYNATNHDADRYTNDKPMMLTNRKIKRTKIINNNITMLTAINNNSNNENNSNDQLGRFMIES